VPPPPNTSLTPRHTCWSCLQQHVGDPSQFYLFLFLTGQVGKRVAMVLLAGAEWCGRIKRILSARRLLKGGLWRKIAMDTTTLRFSEYVFLLLLLLDALGAGSLTRSLSLA